ncbi:peptidase [Terrilactibacillus sp. BCM23-1]|uniref:Peptidase n=1 Tax=Terrilactibacillus tamarindi TaxID=2599694 RepID=A0A6N8CLQ6_9BACI|nr:DUF1796 family putative cysteine peptidase [Terrilactibacillus tamarindi]MTT30899.1 peptidase [Terrilactibacillus tamarindi]
MKLNDIKGSYDVIVSLGFACNPAMKLREHNLRTFSSPLDWCVSHDLHDVSRLFKSRFKDYMKLENMRLMEGSNHILLDEGTFKPIKTYYVEDTYYHVISVHDFPILPNQEWYATYPAFKEKLDRRINRLFNKLERSEKVLFIRWKGSYENSLELQSVLSEIVKGQFTILILNPVDGLQGIEEVDWGLNGICAVNVPDIPFDDTTWNAILNGVSLTNG